MVKIIDYLKKQKKDGSEYILLIVQGGIEMVKSHTSGLFYAKAQKAVLPTTFNETTCKSLIGSDIPGTVIKIDSDPYSFTNKDTGEIVTLNHRFIYIPEPVDVLEEQVA
jgi:hypothetical protein